MIVRWLARFFGVGKNEPNNRIVAREEWTLASAASTSLFNSSPPRAITCKAISEFDSRKGGHVQLAGGADRSTESSFEIAICAFLALGRKPVRCNGIVPGVVLSIHPNDFDMGDSAGARLVAARAWSAVREKAADWLAEISAGGEIALLAASGITVSFNMDRQVAHEPHVFQIDVDYPPAFAAAYAANRARQPLILPWSSNGSSDRAKPVSDLYRQFVVAVDKTRFADAQQYERLPAPVRYRASGALDAWRGFMQAASRAGSSFSDTLVSAPMIALADEFEALIQVATGTDSVELIGPATAAHVQQSVLWQAFNARRGALYEPTPALHRLLDATYIADDVPVGMIYLPVETLCIIPDPAWWTREGGIEAITLFQDHAASNRQVWCMRAERHDQAASA